MGDVFGFTDRATVKVEPGKDTCLRLKFTTSKKAMLWNSNPSHLQFDPVSTDKAQQDMKKMKQVESTFTPAP